MLMWALLHMYFYGYMYVFLLGINQGRTDGLQMARILVIGWFYLGIFQEVLSLISTNRVWESQLMFSVTRTQYSTLYNHSSRFQCLYKLHAHKIQENIVGFWMFFLCLFQLTIWNSLPSGEFDMRLEVGISSKLALCHNQLITEWPK